MTRESQTFIQGLIHRLKGGDLTAHDALLAYTLKRLTHMAQAMLRGYPAVHRWDDTDDVVQGASLRLYRALGEVVPPTPTDYFRLAAAQIRRELNDLARSRGGPHGIGRNHECHHPDRGPGPIGIAADDTNDPALLAEWSELHRQAEMLPDELSSVFDLIYYQGLTQAEAAEVLGVSEATIKRSWREARLALHDALGGRLPGA